MVNILAISEYDNTYQNYDNYDTYDTYQIVNVLYRNNGDLYYDTFERRKEENTNYDFISNGLDISYGIVDSDNVLVTSENQDTVIYKVSGINKSFMFSDPEDLRDVKDLVSYLQVKYAGYIGELDTLL